MISLSFNVTTVPDDDGDDDNRVECMQALQTLVKFLCRKDYKEKTSLELDIYSLWKMVSSRFSKSDKKLLANSRASNSNFAEKHAAGNCSIVKACGSSRKGKELLQVSEVEQVSERLKAVEEETKIMKQELYEIMKERRKLVSELYQQLLGINHCLHLVNQSAAGSSVVCKEEGRDESGLLQVLNPDSSPCIVTRDHRRNMIAVQETGVVIDDSISSSG